MSSLSDKTTIYLNPYVKKFLQHKAVSESRSLSEIINEEFAEMLEDVQDLTEIDRRRNEATEPFEEMTKLLIQDGILPADYPQKHS